MTEQVPKKQKWNKPLVITAGVMLTVAVFYIVMAVFFKSHFTFGTTIKGLNVGGKNAAQIFYRSFDCVNRILDFFVGVFTAERQP